MFYTIYLTVNKINGKKYLINVSSTKVNSIKFRNATSNLTKGPCNSTQNLSWKTLILGPKN